MGWFSQETEQQRLQREMAERLQEQQTKQQHAADEFARSPRGRARAAAEQQQAWLRIEVPMWRSSQERGFFFGVDASQEQITDARAYDATIAEVEAEGWQLFTASSTYVVDGVETSSNGGDAAVSGQLLDVLLFRRQGAYRRPGESDDRA